MANIIKSSKQFKSKSYIESFFEFSANKRSYKYKYISTNITKLNKELKGGLFRKKITTILSEANVGKSLLATSIAAHAMKSNPNLKILHINLEGTFQDLIIKYVCNFTDLSYEKILNDFNSAVDLKEIKTIKSQLIVKNINNFNFTIQDCEKLIATIHKDFNFDLLIIDSPQLMSNNKKMNFKESVDFIWKRIHNITIKYNCATLIPVQATRNRNNQKENNLLRSADMEPSSLSIKKISDNILTLTPNIKTNNLLLLLEKSNGSPKNKIYNLFYQHEKRKVTS